MTLASRPGGDSNDARSSALEVLLVDGSPEAKDYARILRQRYQTVTVTPHQRTAIRYLQRANPALVVAALKLEDGTAVEICREAKSKPAPPSVLVTADDPEGVPDVLVVGCESVLLKPISPNLLVNRTARLLLSRREQIRLRSALTSTKAEHLRQRSEMLKLGVTRTWPGASCPYCHHQGVTSFDYTSNRRAWYACLQCRKVWMAKRNDT